MADMEKIIKEFECAVRKTHEEGWDYVDLLTEDGFKILELLKEQEAIEPGIAQDVDGIFATCGDCKKKLWKIMGLKFVVNPDEMPRFCPHCGRRVKWE